MKNLFLVPTPISDDLSSTSMQVIDVIKKNSTFICERVRTSRRFIKSIVKDYDIDSSTFIEIEKRRSVHENEEVKRALKNGGDICFMSEAGNPCIADPGTELVVLARNQGYQVIPLSGPSSIMMALMSSGLNGQHFTFRGYLPVKKEGLKKELALIEKTIFKFGYSQIFIETPYRNLQLFDQILEYVNDSLKLHVAYSIQSIEEYLETRTIKEWKKDDQIRQRLSIKAPCIFVLGK